MEFTESKKLTKEQEEFAKDIQFVIECRNNIDLVTERWLNGDCFEYNNLQNIGVLDLLNKIRL